MRSPELQELAKRYKVDEPWDSENNQKVMADGADFFSVPAEPPGKDCGYFVLRGTNAMFDPDAPPSAVRNITDGTSRTIAVVEAKRAIPWTKPEDIAFEIVGGTYRWKGLADPAGKTPELGGYFKGGYNALFADGSVHFLPSDLDAATLRALVSRNGRERIEYSTDRPKVVEE